MIAVQELFSVAKNSGLLELLSWLVKGLVCPGLDKKPMPYKDPEAVRILKAKALVDSLSELLTGGTAFAMYAFEKELRVADLAVTAFVKGTDENATTYSYNTTFCGITCLDWKSTGGEPPPPVDEIMSRTQLFQLFLVITVVRVVCLSIEIAVLNWAHAKAVGSSKVTPVDASDTLEEAGKAEEGGVSKTSRGFLIEHAFIVANDAASVFADVTFPFLLASFFMATWAVYVGVYLAVWGAAQNDENIEVEIAGFV